MLHPFHMLLLAPSCLGSPANTSPARRPQVFLQFVTNVLPGHLVLRRRACVEAIVSPFSPVCLKTYKSFPPPTALRHVVACRLLCRLFFHCSIVPAFSSSLPRLISQISSHLLMPGNEELPLPDMLPNQNTNLLRISARRFEFRLSIEVFK